MLRSNDRRRPRSLCAPEPLEGRRLLSIYTGPSTLYPVVTPGAIYQVSLSGGGFEKVHQTGRGVYEIDLLGTTSASTVTVSLLRTRGHHTPVPLQIGEVNVRTGQLGAIQALGTADLIGTVTPILGSVSSFQFDALGPNARIDIAGSLGGLSVANGVDLGPNGHVKIGGDLTGPLNAGSVDLDGGQFTIGNDATGAVNVGTLTIERGGLLSVNRDWTGGVNVGGDLTLDTGGNLTAGREFQNLVVNGNFVVLPAGGAFSVGGDLTNLTVNGDFQGKGTSAADLNVGLNLTNLTVLGGGADQGGLQHVNINVGKTLSGLNVPHGTFNSLITAGVTVENGNVGPDGPDAVLDSQILAGVSILNVEFVGNVRSDFATNPNASGYRTRIVAGEDRDGTFVPNGLIDNLQITGALIDSVLAASVQPNGGTGKLPTTGYNAPPAIPANTPGDFGNNTYDAPFGTITVGSGSAKLVYPNYTELSYVNGVLTGVSYDPSDPTIDDFIFPGGSINPSFASPVGLPSKSTVLGGVISTPHGDNADFAGSFAADTRGVFVGTLPQ